jgi:hypothetical protein
MYAHVKQVTFVCRYCERVLDRFHRAPDTYTGFEGQPIWICRADFWNVTGKRRPVGNVDRSELSPFEAGEFVIAGLWPYRCHRSCSRPSPAVLPFAPLGNHWLEAQENGARIAV